MVTFFFLLSFTFNLGLWIVFSSPTQKRQRVGKSKSFLLFEANVCSSNFCRGMLLTCLWWEADPLHNFYMPLNLSQEYVLKMANKTILCSTGSMI